MKHQRPGDHVRTNFKELLVGCYSVATRSTLGIFLNAVSYIASDILVETHSVANPTLNLNDALRKHEAQSEKDEECPLPAEWVEGDTESEPPDELEISEEVESTGRRRRFQKFGHFDPGLHPEGMGSCQWVNEEHQKDSGIDADVPVSDCADSSNVRAVSCQSQVHSQEPLARCLPVDSRDGRVVWRESLDIPVGGRVRLVEAVIRQEFQRRALESSGHDDDIGRDDLSSARAALGYTLSASVDNYTFRREALNIAANPLGVAGPDGLHDMAVYHWRIHVDALVVRCDVLQVSVEKLAKQRLRDPRETSLLTEDVHSKKHVHDGIARDDPLVAARQNGSLFSFLVHSKLQSFDGAGTTSDDDELLALGVLAVNLVSKLGAKGGEHTYPVSWLEW